MCPPKNVRTNRPQPEQEQEPDHVLALDAAAALQAQQALQRRLEPQPVRFIPCDALLQRRLVQLRVPPRLVPPERRPRRLQVDAARVAPNHARQRVHELGADEVPVVVGLPQNDPQHVRQRLAGLRGEDDVALPREGVQLEAAAEESQAELVHAEKGQDLEGKLR